MSLEKPICSISNKGINAKKTAAVKLMVGHARKNSNPDKRERKMGCSFFKQMIFVKISERNSLKKGCVKFTMKLELII